MFYDSTLQSYGTAVFKFMDAITTNIPAISSKSNIVSISPNPSTNYFTISFTEEVAGEVEVFNNNGLLILQKKLNGTTKLNLNTSDLSNGIYFVKVLKEGKLFGTNKLIICN